MEQERKGNTTGKAGVSFRRSTNGDDRIREIGRRIRESEDEAHTGETVEQEGLDSSRRCSNIVEQDEPFFSSFSSPNTNF